MEFAKHLYGGLAVATRKFQIGEAMATAGVPVLVGGAGADGLSLASTTAAADLVGVTLDAQDAVVSAQQSDNSDPAREVTVIISPHVLYRARLSGGAAVGTALAAKTVTTASTDGLDVTTGDDFTSPEMDEGSIWGYTGANAGKGRKITSTGATAATVLIAFPNDIAVGDTFLNAPYCAAPVGMENQFVQLTTDLSELDATAAVDTDNNNFRVAGLVVPDSGGEGTTKAYGLLVPFDSIFAAGGSI